MAAPSIRRTFIGCLLTFVLASPLRISAQGTELVYISNVTGAHAGGAALTSIEEQTALPWPTTRNFFLPRPRRALPDSRTYCSSSTRPAV